MQIIALFSKNNKDYTKPKQHQKKFRQEKRQAIWHDRVANYVQATKIWMWM